MVFYEENFYRNSILRLQEKMRNTNKTDEKLKEQLMQIIQKDNQITLDVIKYVKKDYMNKLEPFCSQFQVCFSWLSFQKKTKIITEWYGILYLFVNNWLSGFFIKDRSNIDILYHFETKLFQMTNPITEKFIKK
jgi:hypothetical protein